MINVQLLQRELDFLMTHPDQHNQGKYLQLSDDFDSLTARTNTEWHCGSAGCLAGWTAMHLGWTPIEIPWMSSGEAEMVHPDGSIDNPHRIAEQALGLTEHQAAGLFSGGNSIRRMYRLANTYTNGQIQIPPDSQFDEDGHSLLGRSSPDELAVEGAAWDLAAQVAIEQLQVAGKAA